MLKYISMLRSSLLNSSYCLHLPSSWLTQNKELLVYLNVYIIFCSIFKDHFLSQLYVVIMLSPSSDLLSISLGLTCVNNFFLNLFCFIKFSFYQVLSLLFVALSDVFYHNTISIFIACTITTYFLVYQYFSTLF